MKGYVFTLEALLSLLIFALIISTVPVVESNSLKELIVLQQANDLLKVWSMKNLNEGEMVFDTKEMFGNNFSLYLDEKVLHKGFGNESVATSAKIMSNALIERKVRIVVYFN